MWIDDVPRPSDVVIHRYDNTMIGLVLTGPWGTNRGDAVSVIWEDGLVIKMMCHALQRVQSHTRDGM